jgi:hypothetical protein
MLKDCVFKTFREGLRKMERLKIQEKEKSKISWKPKDPDW